MKDVQEDRQGEEGGKGMRQGEERGETRNERWLQLDNSQQID